METYPVLSVVVPCFCEEEVLPVTVRQLTQLIKSLTDEGVISRESYLLFVDDGSTDRTWEVIENTGKSNRFVRGIKLSRNAGHQNALLAGLMKAGEDADCIVSVDADLQDDIQLIRDFVLKFREGYEIVYGVRKSRQTDTWFKRLTAEGFYTLMKKMGVHLVFNHADYRLLSRRAVEHLAEFSEVNLFLRGIIPLLGFKSTEVYYDRLERQAGESKYPLRKMLAFAWDGITSFSITPIRLISALGAGMCLLGAVMGIFAFVSKLLGETVSGWTSLMISIWFIGGVQLICLGLIGEYIGKIYREVKHRPRYIIESELKSAVSKPVYIPQDRVIHI